MSACCGVCNSEWTIFRVQASASKQKCQVSHGFQIYFVSKPAGSGFKDFRIVTFVFFRKDVRRRRMAMICPNVVVFSTARGYFANARVGRQATVSRELIAPPNIYTYIYICFFLEANRLKVQTHLPVEKYGLLERMSSRRNSR